MIVKDKNIHNGVPVIGGTNITVAEIIGGVKDNISWKDICNYYGITMCDIGDCIDYTIQFIKNDKK